MAGFIKLDRDLIGHPAFRTKQRDPFSAFLWLVQEAALTQRSIGYGAHAVILQRGQIAHSIRYIAAAWGWPRMKAHRFLKKLASDGLIRVDSVIRKCAESGTASGTAETLITICNYDSFSGSSEIVGQPVIQGWDDTGTSNKNLRTEEKKKETLPTGESQQPDLLGGEVIAMPTDDVRTAFDAYQAVARDLGLSVPKDLTKDRRPALRRLLKEQGGLPAWNKALEMLRDAKWITSGRWAGFTLDDMTNRVKFVKLSAGGYAKLFDEPPETTWQRERREYLESDGQDSLYRGMRTKGHDGT